MEVDRPAAEEPVVESRSLEERVDGCERGQLARRDAAVGDERERRAVLRDVLLARDLDERAAIPLGEERVALDVERRSR